MCSGGNRKERRPERSSKKISVSIKIAVRNLQEMADKMMPWKRNAGSPGMEKRNSHENLANGAEFDLVGVYHLPLRSVGPCLYGVAYVYAGVGSHAIGSKGKAGAVPGELHQL